MHVKILTLLSLFSIALATLNIRDYDSDYPSDDYPSNDYPSDDYPSNDDPSNDYPSDTYPTDDPDSNYYTTDDPDAGYYSTLSDIQESYTADISSLDLGISSDDAFLSTALDPPTPTLTDDYYPTNAYSTADEYSTHPTDAYSTSDEYSTQPTEATSPTFDLDVSSTATTKGAGATSTPTTTSPITPARFTTSPTSRTSPTSATPSNAASNNPPFPFPFNLLGIIAAVGFHLR